MINILENIIQASLKAGEAILKVYHTKFSVEYKEDRTPLTQADKNAHKIILSCLTKTGIPVLSEEGKSIPYEERKKWNKLWIVDPLDGTKEFVKRNGEFTVNIALVENGNPVMGVIYAPVLDILYFGEKNMGAYKVEDASKVANFKAKISVRNKLPLSSKMKRASFNVVASRSHLNEETIKFIKNLKNEETDVDVLSIGSSLKLCLIAEGSADIYPRFAPTMEWDTAAGDAIVRASGGEVLIANTNQNLHYNKNNLLNPWFIVKR